MFDICTEFTIMYYKDTKHNENKLLIDALFLKRIA